jgi:hypothetical protein
MSRSVIHPFMLSTALVLVAVQPGQAQFAHRYAALTGGASYSSITDYNVASDWRWGATAGIAMGVITFDYSYVELAPSWTQAGGGDLRLDYVDIPLILGGLVPLGSRDMIGRLYAGVNLGLKVSCSYEQQAVCDAAKGSTWAIPVGISIARVVGNGRFVGVDARYSLGLSDVFELTQAKQRSWQFRAMFGLPLGGR